MRSSQHDNWGYSWHKEGSRRRQILCECGSSLRTRRLGGNAVACLAVSSADLVGSHDDPARRQRILGRDTDRQDVSVKNFRQAEPGCGASVGRELSGLHVYGGAA